MQEKGNLCSPLHGSWIIELGRDYETMKRGEIRRERRQTGRREVER